MSKGAGLFSTLFSRYNNALIVSPYRTKMLTNGAIFGVADAICQHFIEKPSLKGYNYQRTLNMVLIGGVFSAPLLHLWYVKWAPNIISKVTSNPNLQPVVGVIADQFFFTPPLMGSFLFISEYLKEYNPRNAIKALQNKMWTGLKTNWTVWPPVQLINFTVIPSQFRVPFVNFVGLFWTIYLSYLQSQ